VGLPRQPTATGNLRAEITALFAFTTAADLLRQDNEDAAYAGRRLFGHRRLERHTVGHGTTLTAMLFFGGRAA
jgi:hypothetical protein